MVAIINGKTITANTFSQIKRLASIEADKKYNVVDTFYVVGLPGVDPLIYRRRNRKAPNNTIIRGKWE